jgi:hypothetical membrane protein
MNQRVYAVLGFISPLLAYLTIAVSISLSPWFSWRNNALSDLGHSVKSDVAGIFNFGLFLTGFLLVIYGITVFKQHAKYTSMGLIGSCLLLQLVATFDEVYGVLHYEVSVLFFTVMGFTSLIYAKEGKSILAVMACIIGVFSWLIFWVDVFAIGIAVPEIISTIAVVSWIMQSAYKIYGEMRLEEVSDTGSS